MPWDPERHGRANLGYRAERVAPPGTATRAIRIRAEPELLDRLQVMTPEARGRLLAAALRNDKDA